jgi:hypothetical protein
LTISHLLTLRQAYQTERLIERKKQTIVITLMRFDNYV